MVRAFREAVVDWLTYNRHGAVSVGVFQSPSGSYRQRGQLTLAAVAAFACLMVEFSNRGRLVRERLEPFLPFPPDFGCRAAAPPPVTVIDSSRTSPTTRRSNPGRQPRSGGWAPQSVPRP